MPLDRARRLVAEQLALRDVAATDGIATLPEWDSLAHMRIVLALEADLGRSLTSEEIVAMAGVADVAALLATGDTGR